MLVHLPERHAAMQPLSCSEHVFQDFLHNHHVVHDSRAKYLFLTFKYSHTLTYNTTTVSEVTTFIPTHTNTHSAYLTYSIYIHTYFGFTSVHVLVGTTYIQLRSIMCIHIMYVSMYICMYAIVVPQFLLA